MNRIEALETLFNNLSTADKVFIWNEYANEHSVDDVIYDMDSFDDLMNDATRAEGAWWLACRIFYGDFKPCHKYFWYDGYANLRSADWETDMPMSIDESFLTWYGSSEHVDADDLLDAFEEYLEEKGVVDYTEEAFEAVLEANELCYDDWDILVAEIRDYKPETEDE